jgi:tetratricopeptide (TPR) repeat protein
MSPEQARGERDRVDRRVDVYSLGATLYDLLAGRPPFMGDLLQVLVDAVETRPARIPGANRGLEAVALKCLEKDPERRYVDAAALAAELDAWLTGRGVNARRRRSWRPIAAAALVAVALAVVLGSVWVSRRAERAKRELMASLRLTATACLEMAIDRRRVGDTAGMVAAGRQLEVAAGRAMMDDPGSAEPHYLLGRLYRAQARFAEALVAQDRALQRSPMDEEARRERAMLELKVYLARVEESRVLRRDADVLAAAGRPGQMPLVFRSARELEDAGATAARERCERFLAGIDNPRARAIRSLLAEKDARAAWASAVEGEPDDETARSFLLWSERRWGTLEGFIDACTSAWDRDRGITDWLLARAEVWYELGLRRTQQREDPAEAFRSGVEDAVEFERLCPGGRGRDLQGILLLNWGASDVMRGLDPAAHLRAAETIFVELTEAGPDLAHRWLNLAMSRVNLAADCEHRDPPRAKALIVAAIEGYDRAIALSPEIGEYCRRRAKANYGLARSMYPHDPSWAKHHSAAVKDVQRARELAPDDAGTWEVAAAIQEWLATQLVENGADPTAPAREAVKCAEEALRLLPSSVDARTARGFAWVALGRHGHDVGILKQALTDFEAIRNRQQIAKTWAYIGEQERAAGTDPSVAWIRAIDGFEAELKAGAPPEALLRIRAQTMLNLANYRSETNGAWREAYPDAVRAFDEAIASSAASAVLRNERGYAYQNWLGAQLRHGVDGRETASRAIDDFTRALEFDPTSLVPLGRRAYTRMLAEQWKEALADWEDLVRRDPAQAAGVRKYIEECRRH